MSDKPTTTKKIRNILAGVSVTSILLSYGSINSMAWWINPVDYWFMWATIFTGLAGAASAIATLVLHTIYLDEIRSN